MLFTLLLTLYTINCILLVFIILIQQGKGGMGLGAIGGGTQMLFGGSGGQDLFQKTTWIMGTIFMVGGLALSIWRTQQNNAATFVRQRQAQMPMQAPAQMPASAPVSE
jgi:preprotein translocase subunit SecG